MKSERRHTIKSSSQQTMDTLEAIESHDIYIETFHAATKQCMGTMDTLEAINVMTFIINFVRNTVLIIMIVDF